MGNHFVNKRVYRVGEILQRQMVQQISTGGSEGDVSFEDYMARYEQKPIYYSKL